MVAKARNTWRGFADFSEFIGSDSDLSIFKSFTTFAARNLLHLQTELHQLEEQIKELDKKDQRILAESQDVGEKETVRLIARSWEGIQELTSNREDSLQPSRKLLAKQMRNLTKEYGK